MYPSICHRLFVIEYLLQGVLLSRICYQVFFKKYFVITYLLSRLSYQSTSLLLLLALTGVGSFLLDSI